MSAPAQDPAVEDLTQKTKEVYLEYVEIRTMEFMHDCVTKQMSLLVMLVSPSPRMLTRSFKRTRRRLRERLLLLPRSLPKRLKEKPTKL